MKVFLRSELIFFGISWSWALWRSSKFLVSTGGRSWCRTGSGLCSKTWKSLWSALSQIYKNEGCWGGRDPCFIALPSTALNCSRSLSLIMSHQTCEAYDSLDTRVASATSHRFGPLNPCDLSILNAYMVWADWLTSLSTCSWKDRSHRRITPRMFIESTRSMPGIGWGRAPWLNCSLRIIISLLSEAFKLKLFSPAYSSMWSSSSLTRWELIDCTFR